MPKSIPGVMHEWKTGQLHSGSSSGPVVKNQRQAVAIALSEQRQKAAKPMHPVMQQRAQMVAEAHAHLSKAVPEFHQATKSQKMQMVQHHVALRLGKVR